MSGISKKLMGTTAAGGGFVAIEDVFSTYLYTGNGSTQTITNGIDLAGEGGLVWVKNRIGSLADYRQHVFIDTLRGGSNYLLSNSTQAQAVFPSFGRISAFNNDGFDTSQPADETHASWTFRKAPRFFDVVTFSQDGSNAHTVVPHALGTTVGSVIVKSVTNVGNWFVSHRSLDPTAYLLLSSTAAASGPDPYGPFVSSTSESVTFGQQSGAAGEYIAYLFAHDPLGPSGDGSDGLIACGSFTTDGSGNLGSVELGWEPQWILAKKTNAPQNWYIFDTMRGCSVTNQRGLSPNLSGAELDFGEGSYIYPTATGFAGSGNFFSASANVIYIAIRRGPMRAPESGTEVFSSVARTATGATYTYTGNAFPVDMVMQRQRAVTNTVDQANIFDRLRGATKYLSTSQTQSEQTISGITNFDRQDGYIAAFGSWSAMNWTSGSTEVYWNFRRAPGFFDVVAYTGDGTANRTVPHNLGVAPELVIVKNRDQSGYSWIVGSGAPVGWNYYLRLDSNTGRAFSDIYFGNTNTPPTDSGFYVGRSAGWDDTNRSPYLYIAYLFATLPGISKVGSYTGNGSNQTINCGFTSGARFLIIKRTDSTGDWYVWDTARGIVTGNDPFLELNTTDAEVTSDDSIDPDSSGFIVNQTATTNVNVSSASYIYLAIS